MLLSYNITTTNNTGDLLSSPSLYFTGIENHSINELPENDEWNIIGGGGLAFLNIQPQKTKKSIGWGIGTNKHGETSITYPEWITQMPMCGIRDYGVKYQPKHEWVPCVSCMDSLFDTNTEPQHEYVFYWHFEQQVPIHARTVPSLKNNTTFEKAIQHLKLGQIVVTNTYHGAYWATLLGRKVVIINPFSTRFLFLKWKPVICSTQNMVEASRRAVSYPDALVEARNANIEFAHKVSYMTGEEIKRNGRNENNNTT